MEVSGTRKETKRFQNKANIESASNWQQMSYLGSSELGSNPDNPLVFTKTPSPLETHQRVIEVLNPIDVED